MTEPKLTPAEIAEFRAYREEKEFEETGVREVTGSLKCPACLHQEPTQLVETQVRRYPLNRDSVTGSLQEDRSQPPENVQSMYVLADERPLPVHDCDSNEYNEAMVMLHPGSQSAFSDERAELAARKDPANRRRGLGRSESDKLGQTMEQAFAAMFARAKEGK